MALALIVALWSTRPSVAAPETLPVAEPLRRMAVALPPDTLDALRERRWDDAHASLERVGLDAPGSAKGAVAFLLAWTAVHGADEGASAAPLLPLIAGAPDVPEAYAHLVRGEVLIASGDLLGGLAELEQVPATAVIRPRALLRRAEALRELGRTSEARALLEELTARPDPADGNAEALLLLADRHGAGSPGATAALARVWAWYPNTEPAREAATRLGSTFRPTWQQSALRAERQLAAGASADALATIEGVTAPAGPVTVDACRLRFTRGRAAYKLNRLSDAATALRGLGEACVDVKEDYGARALYLVGTADFRRKQYAASADAYRALTTTYPTHSMADDGLTRGGIALLEAGRADEARAAWQKALETYPAGDTVPEATLRLAFDRYLAGDPATARTLAARLGALPLEGDPVHVVAGRYWAARWEVWPQASEPNRVTTDAAARARGTAGLLAVCRDTPESFYALLAFARLRELDPAAAAGVVRPSKPSGDVPVAWEARVDLLRDASFRDGLGLLRLGLSADAAAEWRSLDEDTLLPDEIGWITELRIAAGDWLAAHDDLRSWLAHHPIGTLGAHDARIVRIAWPDRYWAEVREAVADNYRYDPRLFHALVREESNFDHTIVSFAGARGLSQLMPATAKETAGWLGLPLPSMDALNDPDVNLALGARYLDAMHRQLGNSSFLALAAYNAGAGNVGTWVTETANPPTDELVERIPYEETRGYVKRVMGSWQTMHWWFDTAEPPFPDLSAFVHVARPP